MRRDQPDPDRQVRRAMLAGMDIMAIYECDGCGACCGAYLIFASESDRAASRGSPTRAASSPTISPRRSGPISSSRCPSTGVLLPRRVDSLHHLRMPAGRLPGLRRRRRPVPGRPRTRGTRRWSRSGRRRASPARPGFARPKASPLRRQWTIESLFRTARLDGCRVGETHRCNAPHLVV